MSEKSKLNIISPIDVVNIDLSYPKTVKELQGKHLEALKKEKKYIPLEGKGGLVELIDKLLGYEDPVIGYPKALTEDLEQIKSQIKEGQKDG